MLRVLLFCVAAGIISMANAQSDSLAAVAAIENFRHELDEEYKNPKTSPLEPKALKKFKGHAFYPTNLTFRIVATLEVTPNSPFFKMMTTTGQPRNYRIYGYVNFTIGEKSFRLPAYQSQGLMKTKEYADYLFFPFTDLTCAETSYGGGRHIDLRIPKQGSELVIDFNQAYNPYCAYSDRYSCPIIPRENRMDIEVRAGVMLEKK